MTIHSTLMDSDSTLMEFDSTFLNKKVESNSLVYLNSNLTTEKVESNSKKINMKVKKITDFEKNIENPFLKKQFNKYNQE